MYRSVITNTLYQLTGKIVSSGLAFITTILLARSLGAHHFGEYTKSLAYLTLFYPAVDFGINTIFIRDFHGKTKEYFQYLTGLRIALGAGLTGLAILGITILGLLHPSFGGVVYKTTIVGSLTILGFAVFISTNAIFQESLRYDLSVLAVMSGSAVALVSLIILLPNIKSDPTRGVLIGLVIAVVNSAVTGGLGIVLVRRLGISRILSFTSRFWPFLLKNSWPLGVTLIFNIIYFHLDILVLAANRPTAEVGAYGLAYKFFEFPLAIPTFLMNSLFPILLVKRNNKKYLANWGKVTLILFGLALVLSALIWQVAPWLVYIRTDFAQSVTLLRLLVLLLPLFFVSSPLMWLFVLFDKQNRLLDIYGMAVVVNLASNVILIPERGAIGAVIATGITEAWVLVAGFIRVRKEIYGQPNSVTHLL